MPLPVADFDVLKTLYSGRQIIALGLWGQLTTVTSATTVVTKAAHGLALNQQLRYVSGTGFTGLTVGQFYFVVAAVAADTFSLSATKGGAAITLGTSSAGVFERVEVFASEEITEGGDQTMEELKLPGTDHVVRPLRSVQKEKSENFTYPTPEPRRLLAIFDGAKSGRKIGTAEIWEPDIDDGVTVCALKSEKFPCEVTRDGDSKVGGGTFTRANLKIKSTKSSAIQWTENAVV